MSRLVDRDHGYAAFVARARKLQGRPLVKVGVLDDTPHRDAGGMAGSKALSSLEVAAVNEFGCSIEVTPRMRRYLGSQGFHLAQSTTHITIPARSFIRGTADEKEAEILELQRKLGALVLQGTLDPEDALDQLGLKVVSMIQARISEGIGPANHWFTIQRKKSSKPLVGISGQLRASVVHRVEPG